MKEPIIIQPPRRGMALAFIRNAKTSDEGIEPRTSVGQACALTQLAWEDPTENTSHSRPKTEPPPSKLNKDKERIEEDIREIREGEKGEIRGLEIRGNKGK
jgi:hypothetical protein